jgi:hypothetical protein
LSEKIGELAKIVEDHPMSKLLVMAGGQILQGDGRWICAFVALSAGRKSRIFRVQGQPKSLIIQELEAETTVDISRFKQEVADTLALVDSQEQVQKPDTGWVCSLVQQYLDNSQPNSSES